MTIKVFRPKNSSPQEVLNQVHKSGIIDYLFSWGYTIDKKSKTISFNLRYGGGVDVEKEKQMMNELESFISVIDGNID